MPAGGWGCPHEANGKCEKINQRPCDPGMKGCELYGRYVFLDGGKNERLEQKKSLLLKANGSAEPADD